MVEPIFGDLAAQSVSVNAESLGGAGLVSVVALKDSLDETLLEFSDCFFEEDAALHHLGYQAVQLISHVRTPPLPLEFFVKVPAS